MVGENGLLTYTMVLAHNHYLNMENTSTAGVLDQALRILLLLVQLTQFSQQNE